MSGTEIAQRSTRGSVVLFAGNFVSTAFLAVSSIIIARLLGPSSYGSYTLVLLVPQIVQLFVGLGVASAITRYSAFHIARGEPEVAKRFSINSMVFLVLFGAALSLVCFASAGPLSAVVLHRQELAPQVRYVSIAVLAQTALQASIAGLVGWNSMGLASLGSILQAALRLSIATVLVVSGFGVYGALTGYTVGYLLAGGVTGLAFYVLKLRGASGGGGAGAFVADVREMVSYGLPVYTGGVFVGMANYFVTVLVAAIAVNSVVGFYQAANNITVAYSLALAAITLALFPAFSSLHGAGADTGFAFRQATKYVAYVMAPVIVFIAGDSTQSWGCSTGRHSPRPTPISFSWRCPTSRWWSGRRWSARSSMGSGRRGCRWRSAGSRPGSCRRRSLFSARPRPGRRRLDLRLVSSNACSAVAGLYFASSYLKATVDLRSIAAIFGASIVGYLAMLLLSFLALGASSPSPPGLWSSSLSTSLAPLCSGRSTQPTSRC